MSDYNIDLGEWGVSSVPALMAKIVGIFVFAEISFTQVVVDLWLKTWKTLIFAHFLL